MNRCLLYLGIVLIAVAAGCTQTGSDLVVTTTGMITDLVQNVGGGRVEVDGLMGPGVDPHLYKASAGDERRMRQADLIIYNGLHLEGKMGDVFEQMRGRVKTAAVTDGLDPQRDLRTAPPGFEGTHDPHVWFDVTLWMKAAAKVRDTLAEMDPDHADVYQANAEKYLAELADLHAYVKAQAERVPPEKRVLITAHDAFYYFGRAYGFEVRGLQGVSTAAEPGAADVKELADFIAERRIPAIFVEDSVPEQTIKSVRDAVRARGFQVEIGGKLYSDSMGSPGTPDGTYVGMVRHNIDTIVGALLR
jgi:manganese/zinc/iron transport system substrate-binding protein